jgi:hypothetical protein
MGLDLLDIVFRSERAFGVKRKERDVVALFTKRQPPDVTAGEWYEFVRAAYLRRPAAQLRCTRCGYPRLGLPVDHPCPECGQPSLGEPQEMWRRVCEILQSSIGCDAAAIRRDSLLRKDLGASL